jgi:hypothetical protein
VARAETEAQRLARKARAADMKEPFERHLADAYAALLSGSGKGRAKRPELVVLVSHEVAKRGWRDVREGELCKIPGVGPVSPQVAQGDRGRCLPQRGVLRRGGPALLQALVARSRSRGAHGPGVG